MHPAILALGLALGLVLAADPPLVIECTQSPHHLPGGIVGADYNAEAAVRGGTPPYTWGARGLPPGLAIDAHPHDATATIAGTPTAAGLYPVELTVVDAGGRTVAAPCGVVVIHQPLRREPAPASVQ